jgi:hypothetical protein
VRESDYLEDVDFDGRPIIKLIFNKRDVARGVDWYDSAHGQIAGSCVHTGDFGFCKIRGISLTSFSRRTVFHGVGQMDRKAGRQAGRHRYIGRQIDRLTL